MNNKNNQKTEAKEREVKFSDIKPENFADMAERVIDSYKGYIKVTSTQMRLILPLISRVINDIKGNRKELETEELAKLQYLKTRLYYAAGRDGELKKFLEKADIFKFIDAISKSKKADDMKLFSNYYESLVAFRKYKEG